MDKCNKGLIILGSVLLCMTLLLPGSVAAEEGSLPASVTVLASLVAETSISEAIDTTDGVVVIEVFISRIKDPDTGETAEIPGGIASYSVLLTADPAGVDVLGVRGVPPYDYPTYYPSTGIFQAFSSSPQQPDNDTPVAKIVARLTGDAGTSYDLTVAFQEIISYDEPKMNVPEENSNTLTLLRGNVNQDNEVNILDALYIAQYIVGARELDTINALNAASIKYDGGTGDIIDILDALYIAQREVHTRDDNFDPT